MWEQVSMTILVASVVGVLSYGLGYIDGTTNRLELLYETEECDEEDAEIKS
jgi:hypothetical protein